MFLFSHSPNLEFLSTGPIRIMLPTPQGAGALGQNSILYFKVADIAAAHKPDSNLVGLMEERR